MFMSVLLCAGQVWGTQVGGDRAGPSHLLLPGALHLLPRDLGKMLPNAQAAETKIN